jgi:hypothetical protein
MSKAKPANNNCKTCRHPQRAEIDLQLVRQGRVPYRQLEKRYGLARSSLDRHLKNHLAKKLEAVRTVEQRRLDMECSEIAQRDLLSVGRILDELNLALNATRKAMTTAIETKDGRAFVGAVGLVQKNVALLATLSGSVQLVPKPETVDAEQARQREYNLAIRRALGCAPDADEPASSPLRDTAGQGADTLPAGVDESMVVEATIVRPGQARITSPDGLPALVPERPALPPKPEANLLGVVANKSFFDFKKLL